MSTVVGTIIYVLLAPLLAGFLAGLESFVSAHLEDKDIPHILQPFHTLAGMYREPWLHTDYRQKILSILYPVLILISGMFLFSGGNLALSILLLLFAELIKIYKLYSSEPGAEPITLERSIAASGTYACQLLLAAAGFYCFTTSLINRGSFHVADLVSTGTAPALHMPAMLIGYVWLLLYGCNLDCSVEKGKREYFGKEQAFFETANWYRMVALYAVLFLFNYGGTVFSAVVSVGICLFVWFLGLLLRQPHSRQPEPFRIAAVSAILLIASSVNLLILLP